MFDLNSLGDLEGVTPIKANQAPPELVAKTQQGNFHVQGFYLLDNRERWRAWNTVKRRAGEHERWLFFGCPEGMAKEVLRPQMLAPYGPEFPRPFGPDAFYLSDSAAPAASIALRNGLAEEGLLISCRLLVGRAHRPVVPDPGAYGPPAGCDSIYVTAGTDLGWGKLDYELFAFYDVDRALLRFVTHIERAG